MINLPGCIILPPGVTKNFPDSKNSMIIVIFNETVHCFGRIKVVRNYVINNFKLHDQPYWGCL